VDRKTKLLALIVFLVVVTSFLTWRFLLANSPSLSQRESATRVMAEYLASKFHPKSVVVLGNPFSQASGRPQNIYTFQNAGVEGLRKGFGAATQVKVVFPKLKPEVLKNPGSVPVDPESKTPLSFLVAENSLDDVRSENPKAEVVVSLIGLPVNLGAATSWKNAPPPHYALLLPDWRVIGPRAAIIEAFQTGKMAAAVVQKTDAPAEGNVSASGYRAAFDASFVLVTRDNVEQLIATEPQLFGLR
jgi:hypothetical protein